MSPCMRSFFFASRRRHTMLQGDWSSDVCSSDLDAPMAGDMRHQVRSRIAAGEEPEAVRAWLVERYGDYVSYKPAVSEIGRASCRERATTSVSTRTDTKKI